MSFAGKFNRGRKFDIDVSGYDTYYKLHDLAVLGDHVFPCRALFINTKGKYGPHPQIATDGYFVSLPGHMTELCKEVIGDPEAVDDINAGAVGFRIYGYETPNAKGTCYSIEWVDLGEGWTETPCELPEGAKRKVPQEVADGEEVPFTEV